MSSAAPPPPNSSSERVTPTTVDAAITALLKFKSAAQSSSEKIQLLPTDDYVYLNLTLKKIPSNSRVNPFKIPLSHPIFDPNSQICLIIDDRPKTLTPPSDQIKKLIKSQNIPISKVIKISKLKTDYKPFESKRKLCDSYDMFLVDKRVVHLLPKLLGKEFYKKKKLPLGVDLSKKNLKEQVERGLGSALMYLRTGTCSVMKVGKVSMEKDEIVENVVDAIKGAVEKVPKKWDGVRSLHLKFYDSIALPIYQAMPDVKLKIEGLRESKKREELLKASDSEGEAKESSRSKSGKKTKKGRIHEVRYMDVDDAIDTDEGEDNVDVDMNESNEAAEEEVTTITETVGKKRSKSVVSGEVNTAKRVKKNEVGKRKKNGSSDANAEESSGKKGKKNPPIEKVTKAKDAEESIAKKGKKKPSEKVVEVKDVEKSSVKKGKKVTELAKKPSENVTEVPVVEKSSVKKGKKMIELAKKPSEKVIEVKDVEKSSGKKGKKVTELAKKPSEKVIEVKDAEKSSGKKGKKKTELATKTIEKVTKVKETKPKKRVAK